MANRHWSATYAAFVGDLGGQFRSYGNVEAFLGGVPLEFANGCLVTRPVAPGDLHEAVAWVRAAGVPFAVRVEESLVSIVEAVMTAHGLEQHEVPMPGLTMRPVKAAPAPAARIELTAVDDASYADFIEVLIATGLPEEWAERAFPRQLLESPDFCFFLAGLDGRPVGTSLAVRTGELGGIYSVGTVEGARRQGVGTAVTWAAVDQIRDWGCTAAVLQSSAMGYPVYRSMGFEEVVRYARFIPPVAQTGLARRTQATQ